MTDDTRHPAETKAESLDLEHLRAIRSDVAKVRETQIEHGQRITRIEDRLAAIHRDMSGLHEDYAGLSARMDRLGATTERIEARLELST